MTYEGKIEHRNRASEMILRRLAVLCSILLNAILAWFAIGLGWYGQWRPMALVVVLLLAAALHLWALLTREISDEDARKFGRASFFGGPFQDLVLLGSKPRHPKGKGRESAP